MKHKPSYTIYIGDAKVLITTSAPTSPYIYWEIGNEPISRAKVLKKVETNKYLAILSPEPTSTLEALKREFHYVRAAGGVVSSDKNGLLMIRLRERWDLPKGHIEEGESSHDAAQREVLEETGISAEIVGSQPIATTWHAYNTYGHWELKSTDWWQMRPLTEVCTAQSEEGITSAKWCSYEELDEHLKESYETIKEVVAALHRKLNESDYE